MNIYVPNELIIRFRPEALNLYDLCYIIPGPSTEEKKEKVQGIPSFLISYLMSQRFYIDDLILDTNLLAAIKFFGGDTLSRITWANPCSDTISISRYGDTLRCEDYLWLSLHLKNDISAIAASLLLSRYFQNSIIIAQPNFLYELCSHPNDSLFLNQQNLNQDYIGAERAWDFTTGRHIIKIGIVDNGLDYRHSDLDSGKGPDKKVTDGWSWLKDTCEFWEGSTHGTEIAGIIGALTNNSFKGVAGITGGWGNAGYDNLDSLGCQLMGFDARRDVPLRGITFDTKNAISAIRVASADGDNYGYGVDILNNSYGDYYLDPGLWAAVHWAFENGVSFIAARGNNNNDSAFYPGSFFPSGVLSVGASDKFKKKWNTSSYGKDMDIMAPGDPEIIFTTVYGGGYGPFDKTSAATAHVSGVVGLLKSFALDSGWKNFLEPEDYEGMLKASAFDLDSTADSNYLVGYDTLTAWGHLQADNIFNMITLDNNNRVYRVSHFSSVQILDSTDWSGLDTLVFYNEGLPKLLDSAKYKVKSRKRYGIISLPNNKWLIDPINKLFVWGRSGQGIIGGYSKEKPNYQTRWTLVTSGTGGNGLVEGIIHNHSYDVEAYTYQYQVWDFQDSCIGVFPPDDQIALNISVFGKEFTPVDVHESQLNNNPYYLFISPNPANDELNVSINLKNPTNIKIEIFDYLGCLIFKTSDKNYNTDSNPININLANMNSGFYICRATFNGTIISKSFVVLK